jgi:serine phosphatase RsbU (regulator of sigma subunit)
VIASFTISRAFRPEGLVFDQALINSLIYLGQLTFIGLVLNRVMCRLFFDEKRAQLALRGARDALFAEMEVAQDIQTLLLPKSIELPGHVAHGLMLPATEVGGDYYDVLVSRGGRRFVAIGDVSGHGVTAGLTMMMARASLLGTLEADPHAKLPVLYAALNRCLRRNLERMGLSLYMTFALFEDRGSGRFDAVGGHLPALIYRRGKAEIEEVELAGVWLGVLDEIPLDVLPVSEIELAEGDSMLLVTDGVVERMAGTEMFGFDRLKDAFRAAAARGPAFAIESIVRAVDAYSAEQDDDVTLVAIEYGGSRREAAS